MRNPTSRTLIRTLCAIVAIMGFGNILGGESVQEMVLGSALLVIATVGTATLSVCYRLTILIELLRPDRTMPGRRQQGHLSKTLVIFA